MVVIERTALPEYTLEDDLMRESKARVLMMLVALAALAGSPAMAATVSDCSLTPDSEPWNSKNSVGWTG